MPKADMGAPIRILHLDDNSSDATLVALTLEIEQKKLPTTIQYVQTKEEYLKALEQQDFDLILSDYRMPGFDGDQALAAAREKCPDIPFIMVTGELGEELVIETLHRGATDYVLKDRMFRLVPAIERALAEADNYRRRREAEREIQKRQNELWAIIQAMHGGIMVFDKEGNVVLVNDSLVSTLGYNDRSELQRSIAQFAGMFELSDAGGRLLTLEEWPVSRILRGETLDNVELKGKRKDTGREWFFSFSGRPVWDEKGKQTLAVVVARDITERKNFEVALRSGEERFRTLANTIPQLAWWADADGYITWYNDNWYHYTGTTPAEMEGWGWQSVHDPKELPKVLERWKASIATGEPFEMVFPLRGANGQFRPFLTRVQPLKDAAGQVVQWFGTNTDINELKRAEEALRASEAMLDAFFANSPGILNLMDEEFRYLKTDSMTPTYFSLDRQSIIGKSVGDLAPEFIREFGPMMRRVIETGEPVTDAEVFSPVPGRPGEVSHWRASYFRVPLPGGRNGIGVMGVDITDMKRTEETIRRLKEEYYLLVEQQTDMVARMSREGRRLYANRNFLQMVGKTEEEVLNSDYAPEIHPEDAPRVAEEWARTFEPPDYRSAIICRTNTVLGWRWLSWRNTALFDEKGKPTTAISVGRDVTEMVQAEDNLRKANEDLLRRNLELEAERVKWQHLVQGIADEIWSCDLNGKMTLMNLVAQTAMQLEEFAGRTIEQVNEEVDILNTDGTLRAAEDAPLLQALKGRIVRGEEIMSHRTTGIRRYRQYSAVPVRDAEGRIVGSVAIVRDATEARQAEMEARRAEQAVRVLNEGLEERVQQRTRALEVANKELEAFSYSVSHDLKAPLRLIGGFADLLVRQGQESLTEKQKGALITIQTQVGQMEELIKALLDFSRLSRQELRLVSVDTRQIVERVVLEQRQILGPESGDRVRVETGELPTVKADPVLLRIVFTNLLSNAFKFTRPVTEPRIRIQAERWDGYYSFRIADNGVGFPKEHAEKLFRVFQRLHGSGEFEGAGIGLANVKKIIERHGGQVCADGAEGRGAMFYFTLPASVQEPPASENPASKKE